jgi:hypothetical protein
MTSLNVSKRLTETVTVKRPTSHSSSGDPVFGAPFTCAARVERLEGDVGDAGGRKRTDSTKLITTTELKAGRRRLVARGQHRAGERRQEDSHRETEPRDRRFDRLLLLDGVTWRQRSPAKRR